MASQKVLLLGPKGQLGQDLIRYSPSEYEILPFGRDQLDLRESEKIEAALLKRDWDILINTAAFVATEKAEEKPMEAYLVNSLAPREMAKACAKKGALFVQISTDFVFDGKKGTPYNEKDYPLPLNTYGITKLGGEFFAGSFASNYYIIRTSSLYGKAGASGKGGNFPYSILRKAKKKEPLQVVDDIIMSPTYTGHLAQAIWEIVEKRPPLSIIHLGGRGSASWYEFAKKILEESGLEVELIPVSSKDFPSKIQRPKNSSLESQYDFQLPPWEEGVKAFLREIQDWLRQE